MTPQEQQKLKEFCDLYDSLSTTLKQIFVSQIPYGTIQNTSNASSHIDVLKEESDDMVTVQELKKTQTFFTCESFI